MQQIPSDFVAKMSHDLKTPVGNAMMYAELMAEDIRSLAEEHPEIHDRLDALEKYCGNIHLSASKLINAIQSWGYSYQIEDGVFEIQETDIDLKELLDQIIVRNRIFIKGKSLDVNIDFNSTRKRYRTDRELITLVIDNLLTLFINMSGNGSSISILVEEASAGIRFSFRLPPPAFNQKLVDIYTDVITIKDRMIPEQGILKPGGYSLIFSALALKHIGAVRGVDKEGTDPRSFWFELPLS